MKKIIILLFFLTLPLIPSLSLARFSSSESPNEKKQLNPAKFYQDLTQSQKLPNVNPLNPPTDNLFIPNIDPILFPVTSYQTPEEVNAFCRSTLQTGRTFEEKIRGCPRILNSIVAQMGTGRLVPYREWGEAQKNRVNDIYQNLERSKDLALMCPDPSTSYHIVPGGARMFLTAVEAFDVFAAHIAHVVYLEVTHTVPWSILNLPQIQLDELFQSRNYYVPLANPSGSYPSHIQFGRDFQLPFRTSDGLVCDPRVGFNFITGTASTSGENLLGASPRETLAKLTHWMRNNVTHNSEGVSTIPVRERAFLQDRLRARMIAGRMKIPVENGCHTAGNLFYDLAKSVNIPLVNVGYMDPFYNPSTTPFTGRYHHGLLAFAGTSEIRILYTLDELIASDLQMVFPINTMGVSIDPNSTEAIYQYFDQQWASIQTLQNWGFQVNSSFPWISPSTDLGIVYSDNLYPDFGRLLGSWNVYSTSNFVPNYIYQREKAFLLCGRELVENFCRDASSFINYYDNLMSHPSEYSPFISRTGLDFYNRTSVCVEAYGGCTEALNVRANWERDFGSTTYR